MVIPMTPLVPARRRFARRGSKRHVRAQAHELHHQAFHDGLTGLANRSLFEQLAAHTLAAVHAGGGCAGVLVLDVDDFSAVNNCLGHAVGDALLCAIGQRLGELVRPVDTVARVGGDEFAILVDDLDAAGVLRLAEQVEHGLRAPLLVAEHELMIAASIGVVCASDGDSRTADELGRDAHMALRSAKTRGGGRVEVFVPSMAQAAVHRADLQVALRQVLHRGELALHYQPVLSLTTHAVEGMEALLRWNRPGHGIVAPCDFLAVAESTGLMLPIDAWVIETACSQLAEWRAAGVVGVDFSMSVNVSARQLRHPGLRAQIESALHSSGIPASALIIEITETAVVDSGQNVFAELSALRQAGVRVVVDDFGTGYSSLRYLHSLPIDGIKVDRSFSHLIADRGPVGTITRAIVALAAALGLSTVAEGIEDAKVLDELTAIGCHSGQGYHIARPLAPAQATAFLISMRPGWHPDHGQPGAASAA
jgi:diguanylate cyclase (GGDEF)-like protein